MSSYSYRENLWSGWGKSLCILDFFFQALPVFLCPMRGGWAEELKVLTQWPCLVLSPNSATDFLRGFGHVYSSLCLVCFSVKWGITWHDIPHRKVMWIKWVYLEHLQQSEVHFKCCLFGITIIIITRRWWPWPSISFSRSSGRTEEKAGFLIYIFRSNKDIRVGVTQT